ncbi:PilW family protein [Motiliproteus coralliicola]|nr:PilW family protein [Motiliproteus coralliicola]
MIRGQHNLPNRQRGLTMVELMIAVTLGLLLTAGILQIFIGSKKTYEFQRELSRIQENGRFAMEFLTRDIRQADFWGCLNDGVNVTSVLDDGKTADAYAAGVAASDALPSSTTGYAPALGPLSDSITLQGGNGGGIRVTKYSNAEASNIKLDKLDHPKGKTITAGDILMVTDCVNAVVFQVTNTTVSTQTVAHQSGTEVPGNIAPPDGVPGGLGFGFDTDATVFDATPVRYWLRKGTSGEPALIRGTEGDDWKNDGVELVEGVENMQFLYGEDTNGDGVPNYFVPAGNVGNMDNVVSVQVHLLLRSIRNNMLDSPQTDIEYYGQSRTATAFDRYIRRAFTATVALRNRLN